MRIILILLDLGLLGYLIYLLFDEFLILPFLITILIALNIIYILRGKHPDNWLFFYLKRKTLEEKKKIEELSSK